MGETLKLHVAQVRDRLAVLTATGDLDMATAGEFHGTATAVLAEHAEPGQGLDLLVNMEHVHFCDSSGFNALLRVQRRVREAGGRFALAAPPEPVARLLALTGGGESLFTLYATTEEGVEALKR
ncbi:STAS domain-containing protein [Actinacidiphila acidipaludis]|uniref:Anti-sigma factor antagonist n=1 Tax=Actinacidiphila acidipaludis TaxID=2873382 RepID=A0ABS7Q521_9ACTN|nr:STAS domain-containing protein [Streptomyces acidipaludis]MBY8878256.1 STAS domain-containing protein [Streptomyces acidipaludis]